MLQAATIELFLWRLVLDRRARTDRASSSRNAYYIPHVDSRRRTQKQICFKTAFRGSADRRGCS